MPSFTLSRRHALVAVACALAVVFAASRFLGTPKSGTTTAVSGGEAASAPPLAMPATATGAVSAVVVIDVAGAVRRPGVYRLPDGSRIADAIARAGGATPKADATLVNLAAPLADGEQVLVPPKADVGTPSAGGAGPSVPSPQAPVDLNTATAQQLDALPGIGPVTAQKIVDYRQQHGPYTSVDDLDAITGIGPARIDNLRSLVIA